MQQFYSIKTFTGLTNFPRTIMKVGSSNPRDQKYSFQKIVHPLQNSKSSLIYNIIEHFYVQKLFWMFDLAMFISKWP